jgi:1-acyl-sn-glycerol-3-phosphate acyltransferase
MKFKKNEYPPNWATNLLRYFVYIFSKIVWRIKFCGTENIPQNLQSGLLVMPNHQTYLDPFWVVVPIHRKLRFMAWDKAYNRKIIGRLMKFFGAFPVNPERGGKESYKKSIEVLREGGTLVIFPEGSREFADGKMLPFKTGAARIAIEAGVPILPVTIRGANRVWSQEMKYPKFFRKIEIIYHPIVQTNLYEVNNQRNYADKLTAELAQIIFGAERSFDKQLST